jgi:hypothetical protein
MTADSSPVDSLSLDQLSLNAEYTSSTSAAPTPTTPQLRAKAKIKPPKPGSKRYQAELKAQSLAAPVVPMPKVLHVQVPEQQQQQTHSLVILTFTTSHAMATCMARAHEHYEGGKLRGPLRGVNFPWSSYQAWLGTLPSAGEVAVSEDDDTMNTRGMTEAEWQLHQLLRHTPAPAYVVAYLARDTSTLLHELAHAAFHLHAPYRAQCHAAWIGLPPDARTYLGKELALRGYAPGVWVDEFQAYVVEGPGELGKRVMGVLGPVHRELRLACAWVPQIMSLVA